MNTYMLVSEIHKKNLSQWSNLEIYSYSYICSQLHLYPYAHRGTFACIGRESKRKGRAMRDMSSVYFNMTVKELKTLRSKKVLAIERERRHFGSYASAQEIKRLAFIIDHIDAVLAAKEAQMTFPE